MGAQLSHRGEILRFIKPHSFMNPRAARAGSQGKDGLIVRNIGGSPSVLH